MEGIHFVTDENGEKIAVQLDLARYGELWEDIYDHILSDRRRSEKSESFAAVAPDQSRQSPWLNISCDRSVGD